MIYMNNAPFTLRLYRSPNLSDTCKEVSGDMALVKGELKSYFRKGYQVAEFFESNSADCKYKILRQGNQLVRYNYFNKKFASYILSRLNVLVERALGGLPDRYSIETAGYQEDYIFVQNKPTFCLDNANGQISAEYRKIITDLISEVKNISRKNIYKLEVYDSKNISRIQKFMEYHDSDEESISVEVTAGLNVWK